MPHGRLALVERIRKRYFLGIFSLSKPRPRGEASKMHGEGRKFGGLMVEDAGEGGAARGRAEARTTSGEPPGGRWVGRLVLQAPFWKATLASFISLGLRGLLA